MTTIYLLICTAFLLSAVRCDEKKINVKEPLTLTISPKIWNLLETKAGIINDAVTSITFPEFSGKKSLVKYRVWDGKVDRFSLSKSGVSFQDMNNGVHLSMKNVQFSARINGRVELGKKVLGKWVRIARMSGEIKAKTENAELDITLTWNDFKFVPSVRMSSDVRVDFTENLRKLNFLRSRVQKMVTSRVNSEVPKKIIDLVGNKVNPRLQQLKQKLISMGLTDYDIEWTVQNGILRAAIKPKSATGVISPILPMENMLCVNVNVLAAIDILPIREKRAAGIDFTCVDPKFKCEGVSCTVCTDVDITPLSDGPADKFHNCLPNFPF